MPNSSLPAARMGPGYLGEFFPLPGAPKVSTRAPSLRRRGALQYLASLAWGRASELAWLVWW